MCQLAAYVGDRPIAPLLLRALELQEPYFGAHATGLGVINDGMFHVEKDYGHVAHVKAKTGIEKLTGSTGIAHTRYNAKAKEDPKYNTREMAHPFLDDSGRIALMHNGGIGNYKDHWERLKGKHAFKSYNPEVDAITDSEVAVHMLSDALAGGKTVPEALKWMASEYTGSFLLEVIHADHPEKVWIANWHQPCYVGIGDDEAMFCSSKIGFQEVRGELDRIFKPPKNSLITLTRGKAEITTLDPQRKVPNLRLDRNELGRSFIGVLEDKGEIDFREMWYTLNPDAWAKAYGISPEEWNELRKGGVSVVNPDIDVVDMLLAEGKIVQRIDPRWEGGVEDTPRFSYVLA